MTTNAIFRENYLCSALNCRISIRLRFKACCSHPFDSHSNRRKMKYRPISLKFSIEAVRSLVDYGLNPVLLIRHFIFVSTEFLFPVQNGRKVKCSSTTTRHKGMHVETRQSSFETRTRLQQPSQRPRACFRRLHVLVSDCRLDSPFRLVRFSIPIGRIFHLDRSDSPF